MTDNATDVFDGTDEFPVTSIAVTTKDGERHVFDNARFTGIWSGRAIVAHQVDQSERPMTEGSKTKVTGYTVKNYYIDLADIDRLELGSGDMGSGTRIELEAPGMLGEDDELDMTQLD